MPTGSWVEPPKALTRHAQTSLNASVSVFAWRLKEHCMLNNVYLLQCTIMKIPFSLYVLPKYAGPVQIQFHDTVAVDTVRNGVK